MAPVRKSGGRTSAAIGKSGETSARVGKRERMANSDVPPIRAVKDDSAAPASRDRLRAVTAERDSLRQALRLAQARLARLEARESVVQDHLTKAIAAIDRVLVSA